MALAPKNNFNFEISLSVLNHLGRNLYAPVRNVVGHTGLLTGNGKSLLSLKYENIRARIKTLVSEKPPAKKKGDAKKRGRRK